MKKRVRVKERKLGRERADGLYHSDGLIEIDERLRGIQRLETLIHEYLHHLDPEANEPQITKQANKLAEFLWKHRVRIIDGE